MLRVTKNQLNRGKEGLFSGARDRNAAKSKFPRASESLVQRSIRDLRFLIFCLTLSTTLCTSSTSVRTPQTTYTRWRRNKFVFDHNAQDGRCHK